MISAARLTAFEILMRVDSGSYASDLLFAQALSPRDAALASEIVFGTLRRQAQLDYLIARHAPARLDTAVRIALRIGIYQLRHLDRVPPHAAVTESVELVKNARKRSAAGLVNAVLRKIDRKQVVWPSRAVELSQPQWLIDQWEQEFGPETTTRIAQAFLERPEVYLRNPPPGHSLQLEPTEIAGGFRVLGGDTNNLRLQDIGSQSIVPLLGLEPGQTFLDLCAAPGNKTAQALESGVRGIACDVHLHRLRQFTGCPRVVLDATRPLPFKGTFDRILLDAPCSGTGTLARNPEIRWRIQISDVLELHEKQTLLLYQALSALREHGRLVYSTCSLERQENEDVVNRVMLETAGKFRVMETRRRTPGLDPGDGFFAAVITSS
ncbi:MAG: transcription antitermination factor NusB [Bryobacteraceae bacterium]